MAGLGSAARACGADGLSGACEEAVADALCHLWASMSSQRRSTCRMWAAVFGAMTCHCFCVADKWAMLARVDAIAPVVGKARAATVAVGGRSNCALYRDEGI